MRFIVVEIVLTSVPRSPLISPNLIWWNNTAASVGLDRDTLNRFSTCKKKKGRTNCPASLHLAIGLPCLLSWFSQINEQFVLPFFFWTGTAQAPEQHAYLLLTVIYSAARGCCCSNDKGAIWIWGLCNAFSAYEPNLSPSTKHGCMLHSF